MTQRDKRSYRTHRNDDNYQIIQLYDRYRRTHIDTNAN